VTGPGTGDAPAPRVFAHLADLQPRVGQALGSSGWVVIDQARIDAFAQATGDLQWIHVDPVRAAAGPFGATVAHGFLTLSLLPLLAEHALRIDDVRLGVYYGLERVRFPAPVRAGRRVRGHFRLLAYQPLPPLPAGAGAGGPGARVTLEATIEIEDESKPACVAEAVSLRYT
jgi:acyl dehydratase